MDKEVHVILSDKSKDKEDNCKLLSRNGIQAFLIHIIAVHSEQSIAIASPSHFELLFIQAA